MDDESLLLFLEAKKMNKLKKYLPIRLEKFVECGWSVIADAEIPPDTYICEYSGNVNKTIIFFFILKRFFSVMLTFSRKLQMKRTF